MSRLWPLVWMKLYYFIHKCIKKPVVIWSYFVLNKANLVRNKIMANLRISQPQPLSSYNYVKIKTTRITFQWIRNDWSCWAGASPWGVLWLSTPRKSRRQHKRWDLVLNSGWPYRSLHRGHCSGLNPLLRCKHRPLLRVHETLGFPIDHNFLKQNINYVINGLATPVFGWKMLIDCFMQTQIMQLTLDDQLQEMQTSYKSYSINQYSMKNIQHRTY